jgi:hypothetical protein
MRARTGVCRVAILAGVALLPAAAGAAIRTVALAGDPAPGTGGGTFELPAWGFTDPVKPAVSETGRVAFVSGVSGGSADFGIFLDADGALTAVAVEGGSSPPPAGGTFHLLFAPVIDASGETVAFGASLSGGAASGGLFVASGGTITPRVLSGDVAPGTGGATFVDFGAGGIDASGNVVFNASLSGGPEHIGTFAVSPAGMVTPIAVVGDTAPGTGGATYTYIFRLQGNDAGDVVFEASLSGFGAGVFFASGGGVVPVALRGATAPETGGGTYHLPNSPSVADDGGVAFAASVAGGSTFEGSFRAEGGTHTAHALVGDPAPGTGGGHYASGGSFSDYARFAPSAADGGRVAFVATVHGGDVSNGLFLSIADDDFELVVPGDYVDDRPGSSIRAVFGAPALTDSRLVAFHARLAEPGFPAGLFLLHLTTGEVPALPAPLGWAVLALLLVSAARGALSSRTV